MLTGVHVCMFVYYYMDESVLCVTSKYIELCDNAILLSQVKKKREIQITKGAIGVFFVLAE